jgi:hypothetical protein
VAVAPSATGTAAYNGSATTQNFAALINVGASDTLAVFWVAQDATQSITSVTWDSGGTNQACTLIGSKSCVTAAEGKIYLYAVVNPTPGSKTLKVVNGTATGTSAMAQSYTGTVTSSAAAACTNALVANSDAGGNFGTAAQSGASGDMYISGYVSNGTINSVSNTSVYLLAPAGNDAAGNRLLSTGASVALTCNLPANNHCAAVSCDIVAAGAATLVTGWQCGNDSYQPRPRIFEQGPALALTPATLPAKITGMGWFEPPDRDAPVRRPIVESLPAWDPQVIAATAAAVPQGWQNWPSELMRRAGPIDTAAPFALPPIAAAPTGWRHGDDILPARRSPPVDVMTFTLPVQVTVGVSGMAWFQSWDQPIYGKKLFFNDPPTSFRVIPQRADGWLRQPEDVAPIKSRYIDQPALVLTPATLPASIGGMAWFTPLDELPRKWKPLFDLPAWDAQVVGQIAPTGISGIAWFVQWPDAPAKKAPVDQPVQVQLQTTAAVPPIGWLVQAQELPRRAFVPENAPALVLAPAPAVGIGWFVRWQDAPLVRRVPVDLPSFVPPLPIPAIAALGWQYFDDILPARARRQGDSPAIVLTPATLPAKIAGMGWFTPLDELPRKWKPLFDMLAWDPQLIAARFLISNPRYIIGYDHTPVRGLDYPRAPNRGLGYPTTPGRNLP